MKVIAKPKSEAEVLAPTTPDATSKEIIASMVAKAECCVDHQCGCSS